MAKRRKGSSEAGAPVEVELGPFTGVRDMVDAYSASAEHLALAVNVYPDSPNGGSWRARPAILRTNEAALGTSTSRIGQAVFQHTGIDGVEYTVAFVGGRMYLFNWALRLFADVTPGGISIHESNRIYCVTFADHMIVTDGANRPWKYNFVTATASVLTDLAYATYGPPAVYYAKLFFIKDSERATLVWSEELDPDTGYENVLYLNRWTLAQTDQEGLEGLAATNAALYYFRPGSIGIITGAVTEDFQGSGTRDSVSTDVGTRSGASILVFDDGIWFVDQHLRQYRIAPGDQLQPLWMDAWKTYEGVDDRAPERVVSFAVPRLAVVLSVFPTPQEVDHPEYGHDHFQAFGASGAWYGHWHSSIGLRSGGVVKDSLREELLMLLDASGFAYLMESPESAVLADSTGAIETAVVLPPAVGGPRTEIAWDDLALFSRSERAIADLEVRDAQGYLSEPVPFVMRSKAVIGLAATTRWVQFTIRSTSEEDRFSIHSANVRGVVSSDHPEAA